MDSNNTQTINIDDMNKSDAIYIIWQLLNKAQSKGVFSIDEACAAKAAITKLDKLKSTLDTSSDD